MFDSITENLIKSIPRLNSINPERLPLELTKIYANVISAKSQIENEHLPILEQELDGYLNMLDKLILGLETLIYQRRYLGQRETLAFVTATAFCLRNLLQNQKVDANIVNMDYVSSGIMTTLLFLIAKDVTDANECIKVLYSKKDAIGIVKIISFLAEGRIDEILNYELPTLNLVENDYSAYAENLLLKELVLGVKDACRNISERTPIDYSRISKVIALSDYKMEGIEQTDTYYGILRLAKCLRFALESLNEISIFQIKSPENVNIGGWNNFLFRFVRKGRAFLWQNHMKAIGKGFLDKGISSVLTYPTGAGKSTIVDMKIACSLLRGEKVVYLVPTHALEKQVKSKFKSLFAGFTNDHSLKIGGEISDYFDEDKGYGVLVSTPERFLTIITNDSEYLDNIGLLVFDEFHLIGEQSSDSVRGVTAMMTLLTTLVNQNNADFVLLSAMVSNGKEIADWIESVTNRVCLCLDDKWKPTRQLQGCLIYSKKQIDELQHRIKKYPNNRRISQLKKQLLVTPYCLFSLKTSWNTLNTQDYTLVRLLNHSVRLELSKWKSLTANRNEVAANLATAFAKSNLKVLVFVTSRTYTKSIQDIVDGYMPRVKLETKIDDVEFNQLQEELGNLKYSYLKEETACAVHHGLMLPKEREIMENCYLKTSLNVLVATPTLAQGINLPADVVIVAGDDRFDTNSQEVERLQAHEIMNAVGRAGRAGQRSYGTAILIPGKVVTIENYTIDERWFDIKNTVFSQGDQCFEIIDPLGSLLKNVVDYGVQVNPEEEVFVHRMQFGEEKTKAFLQKSFAAYCAKKRNVQNDFSHMVDSFVEVLENHPEKKKDALFELSLKTGMSIELLDFLNNFVSIYDENELKTTNASQVVSDFFKALAEIPYYLEKLISNNMVMEIILRICSNDDNNVLDNKGITKIGELVVDYMAGRNFIELENKMAVKRNEKFLETARKFVLHVVPSFSYVFGVISQLIKLNYIAYEHKEDEVSKDLRFLATLVKEGVDSADMLRYKDNNHLMRVACHRMFGKS